MYNGIINVYKEQGYTSFDVVAKLRGILKQKKIGHTGTLDPLAEGVLVVCLGNATKLCELITSKDKEYVVTMQFGIETDTDDVTGNVLRSSDKPLSNDEIVEAINSFCGTYMQLPPMYSAIKQNGKKLYEYARKGIAVEREKREVTIYSIEDIKVSYPYADFKVRCSKGTYIRSLCRDIGERLGTLATMKSLLRSSVNDVTLEDTLKLDEIIYHRDMGDIDKYIKPIDSVLSNYPALSIIASEENKKYALNGNKLSPSQFEKPDEPISDEEIFRVYLEDRLLALYRYKENENILKPFKMFLAEE